MALCSVKSKKRALLCLCILSCTWCAVVIWDFLHCSSTLSCKLCTDSGFTNNDSTLPEFLSSHLQQGICRAEVELGKSASPIPFCKDPQYKGTANTGMTVIIIGSGDDQFVEELFRIGAVQDAYVISSSSPWSTLKHRVISYMSVSRGWLNAPLIGRHYLTRRLTHLVNSLVQKNQLNLLVVLQSFDTDVLGPDMAQWVLDSFTNPKLAVEQLHLYTSPGGDRRLCDGWRGVFENLQSQLGLGLYHVKQVVTGQLVTSWVKDPHSTSQAAGAPYNPASPERLARQIFKLLDTKTTACDAMRLMRASSDQSAVWPVCLDGLKPPCTIYTSQAAGSSDLPEKLANSTGCDVYSMNAVNAGVKTAGHQKARQLPWGLAASSYNTSLAGSKEVGGGNLSFVSLERAMELLGHRTVGLLLLDLDGGEWELIRDIATNTNIKVGQIVSSVHVWYGEETYSLLPRVYDLHKLGQRGYRVFHTEGLQGDVTPSKCCITVGWIRQEA